jgi:hypothetical protein
VASEIDPCSFPEDKSAFDSVTVLPEIRGKIERGGNAEGVAFENAIQPDEGIVENRQALIAEGTIEFHRTFLSTFLGFPTGTSSTVSAMNLHTITFTGKRE